MMPFAKWLVSQPGHPTRAAYPMVDDPFADPPVETAEGYLSTHGVHTVYANIKNHYLRHRRACARWTRGRQEDGSTASPQMVFLGSVAVGTVQAFMQGFEEAELAPQVLHRLLRPGPGHKRSSARSGPAPPWARWSRTDGSATTRTRSAT